MRLCPQFIIFCFFFFFNDTATTEIYTLSLHDSLPICRLHAHIERTVEAEREAALGGIELHRGNAEVERDPVDRFDSEACRNLVERREAALRDREPAAKLIDQIGGARDRALVAVDRQHPAVGRGEDRARIAAGPEGPVDVDAARSDAEMLDDRTDEHGNMAGQSASDVRVTGVAARHHSRAPSSASGRLESRRRVSVRTAAVAFARCARKRCGSQIWNLWPRPTNATASVIPACDFNSSGRTTRPSPSMLTVSLLP